MKVERSHSLFPKDGRSERRIVSIKIAEDTAIDESSSISSSGKGFTWTDKRNHQLLDGEPKIFIPRN